MIETMENFKGTKGKWKIRDEESTVVENTDGLVITETDYPNVDFDETKANALLISKAPEMLEMLEDILEQIEDGRTYITKEEIKKLIKEATTL